MIFLSHNVKDKVIVETIAIRLAKIYKKNNVFYDSWSIQPGDGIIDKMNVGMEEMGYFFFFVSKNSLKSEMVRLEWQNAVMLKTVKKIKFIPVRLDNCKMPAILTQTLYIDLYQNGLEIALRQIFDVIENKNTFKESDIPFKNLSATLIVKEDNIVLEIKANYVMEPKSNYLIVIDCEKEDINIFPNTTLTYSIAYHDKVILYNNKEFNAYVFNLEKNTIPGFPVRFGIEIKKSCKINQPIAGVMYEITEGEWGMIDTEIKVL